MRQTIARRIDEDWSLTYTPDEIIVSNGAKQSCSLALLALINPEDEVIIPAPYWVSYPEMVGLANGIPIVIQTTPEHGWQLTAQQLNDAITPRTKMIILNSPSNPTGRHYTPDTLKALADVLLQHPNIIILSDDIYDRIYWGNTPLAHLLTVCPELKTRTLMINGVSKAYAMTGWRIGYTAGPQPIIAAMSRIQSHSTGCPCSISQAASEAAFNQAAPDVHTMLTHFKRRAEITHTRINSMPYLKLNEISGTFYAWIDATHLIQARGLNDDITLCQVLLKHAHIALVPGSAFGSPGYLRLSFALSDDELNQGLDQLAHYIESTAEH